MGIANFTLVRMPARRRAMSWGINMRRVVLRYLFLTFLLAASVAAFAQGDYRVISVVDGGTISGTVKWSGGVPHALSFPVTKDPEICDPEAKKSVDMERLIIGRHCEHRRVPERHFSRESHGSARTAAAP